MKMEFFDYSASDLNQVVRETSSPNPRKAEDWTARVLVGWVVIREKLTQIWVSKWGALAGLLKDKKNRPVNEDRTSNFYINQEKPIIFQDPICPSSEMLILHLIMGNHHLHLLLVRAMRFVCFFSDFAVSLETLNFMLFFKWKAFIIALE